MATLTPADLLALRARFAALPERRQNRALVEALGYTDKRAPETKAVMRRVQRATTTTGKERHQSLRLRDTPADKRLARRVDLTRKAQALGRDGIGGRPPAYVDVSAGYTVSSDYRSRTVRYILGRRASYEAFVNAPLRGMARAMGLTPDSLTVDDPVYVWSDQR